MGNDAGGALVGSAMGPGCDGKRSWEALLDMLVSDIRLGSAVGKRNQCWESLLGSVVKINVGKRCLEAL